MTLVSVPGRRHYRDTNTRYGQRGGDGPTAGKKATKFSCTGPTGQKQSKRVFNAENYEQPVSIWYEHAGTWYLNTVLDKNNLPDWAKNYTIGEAVRI